MKIRLVLVIAAIFFAQLGFSQQYDTAIGVRGGIPNSLSVKKALGTSSVGEGIIGLWNRGIVVTGLYNIQNPLEIEGYGFEWYYGGGAHVGFFNNRYVTFLGEVGGSTAVIGLDGVIGLEYTVEEFPLNISLDYKPSFNFVGFNGWWFDHVSLGIRYVLK